MSEFTLQSLSNKTPVASSVETNQHLVGWRDYFSLMKPRVMSLVVFTGLCGLVASKVQVSWAEGFFAILALAIGAGAAGAFNMAFDADIDAVMKRTQRRPIPSGRVPASEAYTFSAVMGLGAVLLMALATNYLAAGLLAVSIVFYAVVYTMWLKRRTAQNIVIGGAAGALPPVIMNAVATGTIGIEGLLFFFIIFLWTPPHSWALALYKSGDYARANIPMMPVAAGAKATRGQIMIYTVLYLLATLAPVFFGVGGLIYTLVVLFAGALFALLAIRVYQSGSGDLNQARNKLYSAAKGDRAARDLFAFSIAHLVLLFTAVLLEHGFELHISFVHWAGL